jgi:hypothetical protein
VLYKFTWRLVDQIPGDILKFYKLLIQLKVQLMASDLATEKEMAFR